MKPSDAKNALLPRPSLKHPGRWLWIFLLLPVALGLTRLRFDVEVFDLLPSNLKVVEGLKLYQEYFANARELIITVKAEDTEKTESAARSVAEKLRQHPELVASVTWEPPWLEHPDQAAELIAYLWFNQPPQVFQELKDRLAPDKLGATLVETREELTTSLSPEQIARLSYDPFGLTRLPEAASGAAPSFAQGQESFSSRDGTFRIVFVQASHELRTYRDCQGWLSAVRALAADALTSQPALAGARLGYTGRPAFVSEVSAGMERDITLSVGGTAVIIGVLFWLAHRRLKPMLWLLTLLAVILGCTLALGGLIYGSINVISMGFAAILLGLAVDYAVVHYQEALAHPGLTIPQIRHAIAPSIFWAALTTISAFLVLNFGGLPGLGQLGTLVGLGVALAATIMIFEFLPPLFPGRNEAGPLPAAVENSLETTGASAASPAIPTAPASRLRSAAVFAATGVVALFSLVVLAFGLPKLDPTANALRPRGSPAYEAIDEIQARMNQKRQALWYLANGTTVADVAATLDRSESVLSSAVSNQLIAGFTLPTPLWPRPAFQAENRNTARDLASEREALREAARTNGFSENALALTERVLNTWQQASESQGIYWPTNPMSQWIFGKLAARTPTNYFAMGLINPLTTNTEAAHARLAKIGSTLPSHNVWISGWELLGNAIFTRVHANMWKVVAPMVVLVMLSLLLAFRRAQEILLSVGVLLLSGLCLLCVMRLVGWSWNLLNLMAIPLILGTGVDYSIFMQLALRRHHGDLEMAYRSVGRALLLCGGTAIAGFGSLAFSSNAGMASLGQVCAVGIASNMLIAIFLLPVWWARALGPRAASLSPASSNRLDSPSTPSALYRSEFWRLGLWLVRVLPAPVCAALSRVFVGAYWFLARHRREVVIDNLRPALNGNTAAATRTAKSLFQQFAIKLIDLWRFEAGQPIDHLFSKTTGWEHFAAAQEQKRGILLLTPHLGNWELGGPLLTQRGVTLQVITLAEPGESFTRLRQASRARWDIQTLVIGANDPLGFIEVIRKLESGATVALLVDRPPDSTAVSVELFGRPFDASIAAAELARASGCLLLPVYIPRASDAYEAHILPPIPYDRATLRDRLARQRLTQAIMHALEPVILEHLDQWYHFVPVWLQNKQPSGKPVCASTHRGNH